MTRKKTATILLPAGFGILIVVLTQTQVIHRIFGFNLLQLPLPSKVMAAFAEDSGRIW